MHTLTQRIEVAAQHGDVTFVSGDTEVTVPWSEIHDDSRKMAAAMQARGVAVGDHVGVLGPTTRHLVTAIQATWLAGATVVIVPLPMRLGSIEEFVSQTRDRIRRADTRLLLIDEQLADLVDEQPGDPERVLLGTITEEGRQLGTDAWHRPHDDPHRLAILQFTSGSTAAPKGVTLPHHVVLANVDGMCQVAELQDDDVFVSWLPLYHDMGLVGILIPAMINGCDLVLGAPQDFTARPARWMDWISRYSGSITGGPNFSWALAARALARAEDQLDLSRLRIALNGAEPVDGDTVRNFIEAGARHSLRPGAVFPAFGMAEVAIAGSFPPPMAGLRTDRVDRQVLETERYARPVEEGADHAKEFALLGTPIPGLEMRIVDPADDRPLGEREVGELQIRGTSVTTGYYRDEKATAALFRDGWLSTGDLAYLLGGELVVCGRIKDVIIVGGRNIFPEDVERAAAAVDDVRAGNVIAFGAPGRHGQEAMIVVAETKASGDLEPVRRRVHDVAKDVTGLPPREIVLVPAGSLPKTSSGKLQRGLCRQRWEAGELIPAESLA
jgi:fatty-acyl-CoA synthase